MKTLLKDLLQSDWGPTLEAIARFLALAVAIPAAVLIVLAQWLAFTWRRPLAGVLALVPVRRQKPIVAIVDKFGCSTSAVTAAMVNPDARPNWPALAASDPTIEIIDEAASSPLATAMAAIAADAEVVGTNIRTALQGLDRPAPQPPVLAPGPRRQRRGSKRPQGPA